MRKKNSGFIFMMTLSMILIVILLVLTCMQHVLLYYKAINKQEEQRQNFYQLEHIAMQLARAKLFVFEEHCIEHGDSANQIIEKLNHKGGCLLSEAKNQYRYLIEELGDFPCLVIEQENKNYSTHHRRVSLLTITKDGLSSFLQIRYISPVQALPCLGERHLVASGLSSWRYLP